jgi:hypothetical protein
MGFGGFFHVGFLHHGNSIIRIGADQSPEKAPFSPREGAGLFSVWFTARRLPAFNLRFPVPGGVQPRGDGVRKVVPFEGR